MMRETFAFSFTEGEVIHKLPVGFGKAADGCVDLHGEHYLVATLGEFARDENDIPVLKLEVTFYRRMCENERRTFSFMKIMELKSDGTKHPAKK